MVKRDSKPFGLYIREQRLAQGLTQEQLGFESDLAMQTISEIETGKRKITTETIYKLSNGLDIDITELLLRYMEELQNKNMMQKKPLISSMNNLIHSVLESVSIISRHSNLPYRLDLCSQNYLAKLMNHN